MTDEIAGKPETFDLIAAIEGTTRPETEVPFWFDERAAQAIANIEAELQRLLALGKVDEYTALEDVKVQLIEDMKTSQYTVTVKGIPTEVEKSILLAASAKFPDKTNAFGQSEPNIEGMEYLDVLMLQAYIAKFEAPNGAIKTSLSEDEVILLKNKAPKASLQAINQAIRDLNEGPKSGYDQIVQGLSFLSERSPEA